VITTALLLACGDQPLVHNHQSSEVVKRSLPENKPAQDAEAILANPVFIAKGKKKKSLDLQIISSYNIKNGGMNFNGEIKGSASYEVPKGHTINVIFINRSAAPHSAVIVEEEKNTQLTVGEPYFKGAGSNNPKDGSSQNKIEAFSFVADEEGTFIVACGFPSHTLAGQWIYFKIGSASSKACYKTENKTLYAK
jgi:hypothetical protein